MMEFMDLMKEWLSLRDDIRSFRDISTIPETACRMQELEEEINRRMRGEP